MIHFTGSSPNGNKAEIRQSESPYENGLSVFTWRDDGSGVILWRERHELSWDAAYSIASEWLKL